MSRGEAATPTLAKMPLEPERYYGPQPKRRSPVKAGPTERVSNAERDAVVEQLRLNCAEGRLDMDEFGERTAQALGARTGAELTAVLHDLPLIEKPELAAARRATTRRAILVPYIVVNAFLVLVWLVTGAGYFWPIWPILGWGLGVAMGLFVPGRHGRSPAPGQLDPPRTG